MFIKARSLKVHIAAPYLLVSWTIQHLLKVLPTNTSKYITIHPQLANSLSLYMMYIY